MQKSVEYAARIISSIVTDTPDVIYGNVLNRNLIANLPENACVEVPCDVSKSALCRAGLTLCQPIWLD